MAKAVAASGFSHSFLTTVSRVTWTFSLPRIASTISSSLLTCLISRVVGGTFRSYLGFLRFGSLLGVAFYWRGLDTEYTLHKDLPEPRLQVLQGIVKGFVTTLAAPDHPAFVDRPDEAVRAGIEADLDSAEVLDPEGDVRKPPRTTISLAWSSEMLSGSRVPTPWVVESESANDDHKSLRVSEKNGYGLGEVIPHAHEALDEHRWTTSVTSS